MNEPLNIPVQVPQGDATLAILERIAAAVEDTGKKSEEASQKTESGFARAQAGIRNAADTFNEVREAVTNLLGDITSLAEGMAAGADEADALANRSRELGVDFDEAAESAGRFLDETAAMGAANQLAARGIRLSQEELNALTRVAGATSQALRITTEEGVSRLTDALISGRGRALAPFGAELSAVAGNTHTMEQRLHALVQQAGNVEPAVDTATDSINRFKDSVEDTQRSFSAGFVEGLRRMNEVAAATRAAGDDMGDLNADVRALGGFVAETLAKAANGFKAVLSFLALGVQMILTSVGALGAALEAVAGGNIRGAAAAAARYMNDSADNGRIGEIWRELRSSVGALNAQDEAGGRPPPPDTAAGGPSAADAARDRAARGTRGAVGGSGEGGSREHHARGADMTFTQDEATYGAEGLRLRREAVARAAELRERAAMDELIAAERTRQQHQRGSTLADRLDQQREQRALTRAQRNINDRLAMEVSFTDRMEDLHSQRVNAAEQEAEFVTSAFNSLGQAMGKHIQLVVTGEETIGTALQGMLADTLSSIGQEAIVKGAMQIAEGLAALAGIVTAPLAPGHFAAGAAFIGVGALASAAGAALAPAPSVPSGGGGGGGGSAGRAASVSKGGGDSGDGSTVVNVMFGGPQYGTGGTRQAAREIAGVLNRGAVQGGVRLNLRAAGGAF